VRAPEESAVDRIVQHLSRGVKADVITLEVPGPRTVGAHA
jgi:hypothetical protein